MQKAKELDQFYTHPNISIKYYNLLSEKFDLSQYFLLEPSAGNGSFSDLFIGDFLAFDLDPKKDYIIEKDFFNFDKKTIKTSKPLFIIGNPPFGKNSSLAVKFLNKSGEIADYIAFILPKSFKKPSMHNKINLDLHLVFEEDLEKYSFLHNDLKFDVPCVFQIWEKRNEKRKKIIGRKTTELFDFCSKEQADFAIRRVGNVSGRIFEEFEQYKKSSNYYIKINKSINKQRLIDAFHNSYPLLQKTARDTVGSPSLSKNELIEIIEKIFYKE